MATLAEIQQKLTNAIDNLFTLSVVTVVYDSELGNREIKTEVKLATGDISTRIHSDFINGDLTDLRAYHAEQVEKGQSIIAGHVRTLVDLLKELKGSAPEGAGQ
ncbi:MAG: hypothetical protein R3F60_12955 [bacterium]